MLHFRTCVVLARNYRVVSSLRKCREAFALYQIADFKRRYRHHRFFHRFDAHRRVLVVGRTLFDSTAYTAQDSESKADYGFGFGEYLKYRIALVKS